MSSYRTNGARSDVCLDTTKIGYRVNASSTKRLAAYIACIEQPAFDARRGDMYDISSLIFSFTSWTLDEFLTASRNIPKNNCDVVRHMIDLAPLFQLCTDVSPLMIPVRDLDVRAGDLVAYAQLEAARTKVIYFVRKLKHIDIAAIAHIMKYMGLPSDPLDDYSPICRLAIMIYDLSITPRWDIVLAGLNSKTTESMDEFAGFGSLKNGERAAIAVSCIGGFHGASIMEMIAWTRTKFADRSLGLVQLRAVLNYARVQQYWTSIRGDVAAVLASEHGVGAELCDVVETMPRVATDALADPAVLNWHGRMRWRHVKRQEMA